jgi:beta-lactamase regulating signal transducer with metallopeptidase domain
MAMSLEFLAAADRLVSASLNGLYQGLIVTVIVAVCLRLGRTNAATRHAVWLTTLLVVALLIPAHCLRQNLSSAPPEAPQLTAGSAIVAEPTTEALNPELTTGTELEPIAEPAVSPAEEPISGDDAETDSEFELGARSEISDEGERPAAAADPVRSAFVSRLLERLMNPVAFNVGLGGGPARYASVGLLGLWLGMTGVCIGVLLRRLHRIRCLKRSSTIPGRLLQAVFDQVKTEMCPKRAVNLRVSSTQLSPVVLGFFEPMVLLPATLPLGESEQILRHELAHACRADDWANLFQHCVSAVLFFHPAVWWIGRRLSLEREIACDDQVLRHGGRPRAYALLLADLAGRVHGQTALLAPGASNNKSQLQQTID